MFLSSEELQNLTGFKRPGDQLRWLLANGVPHFRNGRGRPVVVRDQLETRPRTARPAFERLR